MKTKILTRLSCLTLLSLLAACGGATTPSSQTTPPESQSSELPSSVSALLSSECNSRPTPQTINATVNGTPYHYTETLAEQDEGHEIASGTHLLAANKVGRLVFKASTDGKVVWGARKWALAGTQAESNTALGNITIRSETISNEAQVVVNHPNNSIPIRYEVCLVVLGPADWEAHLTNETGDITSENHSGLITTDNNTGDTIIAQNGPGFITATTNTGDIIATGDSRGGVNLVTNTGSIISTLTNGGVSLQTVSQLQTETGNIILNLADGFGLNLTASSNTGDITVPSFFPAPTEHNTGFTFSTEANGGGATLSLHTNTGSINIVAQ